MANTRVNIDVNINTSDAARNLRQLQAQINSFQSALNTNNRLQGDASRFYSQQLKDLANQSGMFSAETVKMRTAASQLDQTLSKGQGTMRQFVSAKFLKDSAAAAQVLSLANSRASALQTQFVATGAAANGFREAVAIRPLQAFNSETAISAQKLAIHRAMLSQSTTSMINFGKNTQWAGRQLMVGFTVPLTIFAATAGKVFREIEKESLNFRKVYGDSFTTPEELNANLLAVQGLAKEYTKYGIAVKDTIGLAAQAAAAGSQGADLIDATTEATRLATLGQMDQNQALETTIALQTAFNLSGKDLSKTINFLNMVENQTVVTLQDLAQAIPRVAPVIKGLGGSVEDMAVMLAAMREGGITAAQGANALKSGLASLINPTDRAVESLDKMGINLTSIINMNRGDLLGTVKSFGEALASLDEFSRQQALEKVFGKFQYARLGALFNNIVKDGSQASRVMDTATMSAEQLAKSAEKELGAIEDSAATKFVAAMEKLKLAIAPIGEMFIQMATPVLGLLGSLVDKFNELPDFAKKFIGFGTVITGIIIPAGTMFLGLLMNLAGTLTKFGLVVGVAFKGFAQGGLKGSVEAVSQALNFMSLAEIDAATASSQLGTSTGIVNQALRDQVPAAAGADAAIDSLSRSYAALIVQMTEAATLSRVAFVAPGAAMAGAAATGAEAGKRRGGPRIRRNSGGTIPGSGNTDTVPAMLTPGEFVVNKQATGENLALLHAINKGREVPGFNKGGQIPGMQYFGGRFPGGNVQQMDDAWKADQATFAGRFGIGGNRRTQASNTASSRGSENIYNSLTGNYERGQNVRVDTLRYAVEKLGFNPQQLGLKTRGNLTFRMSKDSNLAMMRGDLTRDNLLKELETPDVYSPLSRQLDNYLGARLDTNVFDRMYREEIGKLPLTGINNGRFEKASRNAVRRYLDSAGFPKARRNSFIRDVLQGDTVNANMSLPAIKQALDARGIQYTSGQSRKDLYVDMDGRQVNIGNLAGRESGNLGRPQGILDYAGLRGSGEAVHANKGGMIPGVQNFNAGGIAQLLRNIALSRNRIGGVSLQRRTSEGTMASSPRNVYDKEGVPWERWRSSKRSRGYRDLLDRGYITETEYDDMVGSGRYAVHGVSSEFRGSMATLGARSIGSSPAIELSALLASQKQLSVGNIGKSMFTRIAKIKPSSLINGTPRFNTELGTGSATLESLGPIGGQHMIGLAEQLMGRGVDKALARQILDKAAVELKNKIKKAEKKAKAQGRKGINEREFADALTAAEQSALVKYSDELELAKIVENKGGMIPMLNGGGIALAANAARGARGRIPANIVDWFSKMTTSISQSNRDDMLQNIPANIRRGLSTARRRIDITRGSVDPIDGGTLKEVSSWSRGQGVGRFMESSKLFETMNNSKFQIAQRSQSMKRDIDWLKSLGPDGPHPMQTWSPFHQANGGLHLRLTPEEIQESGGVIWKANKKKLEERIRRDQEFIAGHQKIIDDLQESNIPTIYRASVKKGEKYFDVSDRIVPREDQRLNNPAASNAILEEKEVALLGARLTGRAKTRIVEREEAQARYDKAKEEIKRIRMAIFNKETSAEEAKPDLDRLYDESENMAAFVNWGRGREVSYPNVVSRNMGGIIPDIQYLMAGAKVLPSLGKLEKIKQADSRMAYVQEQGLDDILQMGFNDTKTSSPSSFLSEMFARWERIPSRPSLKEDKKIARKTGKLKYPMTPQDEYLADMILSMSRFDDYAPDAFKPITVGRGTVYDGHTRIQAQLVRGLIEKDGREIASMSKDDLLQAIESVKRRSLAGEIDDSNILSIAKQQRVLTQEASRREIEGMSPRTHPKDRKHMLSMFNMEGRSLVTGVHDREISELVSAGRAANFRGYGDTDDEILRALGFVGLGTGENSRYSYNPTHDYASRKGYVANTSSRIIRGLVDEGKILPLQRNMGGIIPQMRNIGGQIFDSTKTSRTIVPGVGNKDTVPAALTPGEFVINKDATRKNLDLLRAVNNGTIRGYAEGDIVTVKSSSFPDRKEITRYMIKGFPDETYATKREAEKASKIIKAGKRTSSSKPNRMMGRGAGLSMGIGAAGGAMMMSPMVPGIGQNEGLSSVLSSGGMALSLLSILPMMGQFGVAIGAIAVPLAAATVAFKLMRENIDKIAQESVLAGQNLGGAAGRMEELSAATGYQFSLSKSQSRMFRFTDQQAQDASQFSDYFEGEKGQGFVKELKDLSSEKRYKKVASIIAQGVADGMDPKTAQAYGNAIAAYTNDAILKARLSTDFKKGKFSSGTQALVDLLKERESAVAKETTSMGQLKEVNLNGAGQLASDALNLDGANAQFANLTATVAAFVGLPIFGPMIGLGVGLFNFNKEMDKVEENTKIVATSFGGSLEVLKEVANAETAISEARRNNSITEQQAAQQLLKVREVEESATNRLRASLTELQTGNVDAPGVQQGLKNALILNSGFDEAQANAVVETMNFDSIATQLFPTKDLEEIKADPAYSQAVVAVIADTLSGITPENAGQKIADIQSQYGRIAEAIVQAGVDGMSAVEIRGLVTAASSEQNARSALEGLSGRDLTESEVMSTPAAMTEAAKRAIAAGVQTRKVPGGMRGMPTTENYMADPLSGIEVSQTQGLKRPIDEAAKSFGKLVAASGLVESEVAQLNAAFAELSNFDLAVNISKSKEEFTRFSGMVRELSKFPGIDIEVMMQTETGQDPKVVAKNIEDTIKKIGEINFKKSFGKNWEEMSAASTMLNPQEFITMSRKIQKAIDPTSIFKPEKVTEAYKETLSDLDKLRDNFKGSFDKESGLLKKVQVEMIPTVFGEDVENAQAIANALNDALPNGFNPILLPIMAQLMMDPKLAAIMQNPGNLANIAEYINSGGTTDKGYRPEGFTADSMQANGGQKKIGDLGITTPSIPGSTFGGAGGSGKGGGGGQKSLIQQLKDQFKSLQDIYEGYAKNISKKTGMFKGIAAGPFGQQFIDYLISQGDEGIKIFKEKGKKYNQAYKEFVKVQIQAGKNFMKQLPSSLNQQRLEIKGQKIVTDQLAEQGFSASGIERIVSAAPEGEMAAFAKAKAKLAKAKAKKNRGEKLTEEDKLTKDQKAIVSKYSKESTKKSLIPSEKLDKEERNQLVQSKEDAFELEQALSGALGKDIDPQVIDTLKEMGYTAEEVAANYDEISKYAQRLNDVLTQTSFTDQMKDLSTETDNAQRALKLMGQGIPADIANQIANMGNSANFSADQIQDLANTMQQLKILKLALQDPAELRLQQMMNQERINQLNYEIGLIESVNANEKMAAEYVKEKVTNHEDLLAVYERQNDAKSREIELRQRDLEPLDEQIEKLEEQKTKIEENYDAQSEALDEVIEKENELFAIKAKSLDVAGALSRGDVAGAAKAALELEKELSQQRSQDQRQILDQQRKLSIEAVDTRIKTLADQKKVIEQDILRLQKEQRAIQDKIYNAQLIINNEAARLEGIYKLGNNQVALLKQELILAEQEQRDLNAAVQAQIDLMKELGRIPRNKTSDSESSTDSESGAVDNTNTETSMNVPTPSAPTPSAPASRPSTPTPTTPKPPPPPTPPPTPTADRLARPQEAALEAQRLEAQREATAAAELRAAQLRSSQIAAAAAAAAKAAEATRQKIQEAAAAERARDAAAAAAAKAAVLRGLSADRAAQEAAAERARVVAAQNAAKARAANRAFGGFISKYAMGGRVNYKGSTERAPGMMYGGSAKKFAYGSTVPGRGMTDKVPALLTPGEFVVRKRVAEQYGPLLELLNGQVFPTMKTNSFNSSSKTEKSGSMYNYNVNVTLNGSDMDANDVANAVIQKIKMTENKGIRSNNIRG